jgi:hypothetical protein
MSGDKSTGRDYKREYAQFHGKPAEIKKRAKRNAAHAQVEKKVGSTSKDVHHKNPIRNGGGNSPGNLAVTGTSHRGWNRKK